MLYRPIADGKEFNNLIPKPTEAKKTLVGDGDTSFSIKKMVDTVLKYNSQLEKVAKKLQSSSLTDSIDNVKDFIYNHFQYKADLEDQLLRSPSYAWHIDRYDGIDCKSYSILASCLFTQMGILHYIRRIKQPSFAPTEWTHVYVVVPVDQKSGDLKKGYYTVDGTLYDDYEPEFIEKNDTIVKHYVLNAPSKGLGLGIFGFDITRINSFSINNLMHLVTCAGGSAYTQNGLNIHLKAVNDYYNNIIDRINNSIETADRVSFNNLVNEFKGNSNLFVKAAELKASQNYNQCTEDRIKVNLDAFKFFRDTVGSVFEVWLNDNFIKSAMPTTSITYTNEGIDQKYGFVFVGSTTLVSHLEPKFDYQPKPKAVPKFQITPYVETSTNNNTAIDPLQFLSGLTQIANSFTNGGSGTNPGNGNGNGGTYNNLDNPPGPKQTAGLGVGGWILLAVGIGLIFKKTAEQKDNPARKPRATRTVRTSKTKK